MSDTLPILMAQNQNSQILQAIKAYGKNLLRFIRRRVKTDADAEDILQDVWYQLSAMLNIAPVEQTGAWLYKVAGNKIIDKHKKHSETLLGDLFVENDETDDDLQTILLTETTTPETEYLRGIFWQELFAALNELPDEQRQVFIWHEIDDLPFSEIAEKTGEKMQTLVSRKRYAVLHLRERLRELYHDINKF